MRDDKKPGNAGLFVLLRNGEQLEILRVVRPALDHHARHPGKRFGEVDLELPALDQVRISRWSGANLVLVGVEHVGRQKQSRPQLQAWWVQLVTK